ncbi:NAD-dependent epimerase/dehydratase family protein [Streptomyces daliensis]
MRVLLTGGTGYIGGSVLDRLVATGHRVTALVRNPDKAEGVRAKGAEVVITDLADADADADADAETVHRLVSDSDGVVHLASPGDETSAAVEETAVTTMLRALGNTGKPFVHTTGVWVHGSGSAITESTPMIPLELAAWRVPMAGRVRNAPGVRSSVVAPAVVHGHGGGLLNLVAAGPRSAGDAAALTMVGPGDQHWSTVHVDDLAELYVLALEQAPAGSYFLGASGVNPTVREITEAVSRSLGLSGRVQPEPVVQTLDRLGPLGAALLLDQQASGDTARRVLGWAPSRPTILEDIAAMSAGPAL